MSASLLGRGYFGLLQPLEYHQVCPFLFMWVQLTAVKLLGFSEYSLRLFPFLCSLASMLLFRQVAGQVLKGTALVITVGIFSVAYPCIRYAAEAKPYGCDLLVSLVLLTFALRWWRDRKNVRWLWGLSAVMPVALGLSYPAVFVAGGVSLAAAWTLCSERARRGWVTWIAYNVVLVGSYLAVYVLSTGAQSAADLEGMREYWQRTFPPLGSLWELIRWLIATHSGGMLAYPFGGPNGGSILTLVCCAIAVAALFKWRQFGLLVLCLAPLALNLVAAGLHRYPYGGHVRMSMYAGPAICLLAGLGLSELLAWRAAGSRGRAIPAAVVLVLLATVAAGSIARDFRCPGKSHGDIRARDFARWFWFEMACDGEIVCLKSDLNQVFSPKTFEYGSSAMYLCNQRIYSARHAKGEPPRLQRVAALWPLRCVVYRSPCYQEDQAAFGDWLETMKSRYDLVAQDRYPFTHYRNRETLLDSVGYLEVYKFIPKGACAGNQAPPAATGTKRPEAASDDSAAHVVQRPSIEY